MKWRLTYGDYEAARSDGGWLRVWRTDTGWAYSVMLPTNEPASFGTRFPTHDAAIEAAERANERAGDHNGRVHNYG
jgi:hypothetical protein